MTDMKTGTSAEDWLQDLTDRENDADRIARTAWQGAGVALLLCVLLWLGAGSWIAGMFATVFGFAPGGPQHWLTDNRNRVIGALLFVNLGCAVAGVYFGNEARGYRSQINWLLYRR